MMFLEKGQKGVAYDIGNGKVKKVFKRGRLPISYQLLFAAKDFVECLPAIYEIGDDYIIRDDLKFNTQKCKQYYKIATSKPFANEDTIYRMVLDGKWEYDPNTNTIISKTKITPTDPIKNIIEWMARLKYELSQICGNKAGLGDFALKNLAETSDGRIVLADF